MDDERPPIANRVKQRPAAGQLVLCLGTRQARTPDIAMIVEVSGFDAFYIDMEHSTITLDTAAALGARFMIAGSDVNYLMAAAEQDVRAIRALEGAVRP